MWFGIQNDLLAFLKNRLQLARPELQLWPLATRNHNKSHRFAPERVCLQIDPPLPRSAKHDRSLRRRPAHAAAVAVVEHLDVQRYEPGQHCGLSAEKHVRFV